MGQEEQTQQQLVTLTINGVTINTPPVAADTSSSLIFPGLNEFAAQTSGTFSYTFSTDENYKIAVGVIDVGDDITSSALLVENVKYQAIPEPFTILGTGSALALGTGFNKSWREIPD